MCISKISCLISVSFPALVLVTVEPLRKDRIAILMGDEGNNPQQLKAFSKCLRLVSFLNRSSVVAVTTGNQTCGER